MNKLTQLITGEEGVTALEYGLIASLIAAFIVGAVTLLGQQVSTTFNGIATDMGATPQGWAGTAT